MLAKITLQSSYEPHGFFEEESVLETSQFRLRFSAGTAEAILTQPCDPLSDVLRKEIESKVNNILDIRRL
jgi:hypothetical protein